MDRRGIWEQRRRRLYSVVETGNVGDAFSRGYDVLLVASIVINLAVCVAYTFDSMELNYGPLLLTVERVTVTFFAVDYVLRVWTAKYMYPDLTPGEATWKYVRSITGIIDLQIAALNKRLADKQLTCELTPAAKTFVIDAAYDPQFGARPLRRYLQHTVETLLAQRILRGDVLPGQTLVCDVQNGELVITAK